MTSRDSISVTVPSAFSPMKTYPLECSLYLINIHFLPLEPNFPNLGDELWTKAVDPQVLRLLKSGFRLFHNSYGVDGTDFEGTRLSM